MRVSEGLRLYYEKLFPGSPINEDEVKAIKDRMWLLFYQQAANAAERLGEYMVKVPADVLRVRNGTDRIAGDPTEAQEMLVRAIGGVQACEQVAAQHAAELEIFTPEYMERLFEECGLADL